MVIEPGNNVNSGTNATGKARQTSVRDGQVREGQARADKLAADKTAKPAVENSDNVSLSDTAQSLSRLEAAVASSSDVNAERVAEIKAALEKGQYRVDAYALAGKMLGQEEF